MKMSDDLFKRIVDLAESIVANDPSAQGGVLPVTLGELSELAGALQFYAAWSDRVAPVAAGKAQICGEVLADAGPQGEETIPKDAWHRGGAS